MRPSCHQQPCVHEHFTRLRRDLPPIGTTSAEARNSIIVPTNPRIALKAHALYHTAEQTPRKWSKAVWGGCRKQLRYGGRQGYIQHRFSVEGAGSSAGVELRGSDAEVRRLKAAHRRPWEQRLVGCTRTGCPLGLSALTEVRAREWHKIHYSAARATPPHFSAKVYLLSRNNRRHSAKAVTPARDSRRHVLVLDLHALGPPGPSGALLAPPVSAQLVYSGCSRTFPGQVLQPLVSVRVPSLPPLFDRPQRP